MGSSFGLKLLGLGTALVVLGICAAINARSPEALYMSAAGVVVWVAGFAIGLLGNPRR